MAPPKKVADSRGIVCEYLTALQKVVELERKLDEARIAKADLEERFPALVQIAGQTRKVVKGPVWSNTTKSDGRVFFTIAKDENEAKSRLMATAQKKLDQLEKKASAVKRKAEEDLAAEVEKRTKD